MAEGVETEYGFQEEKEESVQPDSENEDAWGGDSEEENDQQMRKVEQILLYEHF